MQNEWYFISYAKDSGWLIFIASEDENQIGYGQIRGHDDDSVEIGLAVGPDLWGQGYGSAIMDWLVNYATAALDTRDVWLEVYERNERAIRLYEKYNFRAVSKRDGVLRMELQ
jgi:RimJ/RimL family protein N-acetyltransferase